MKIVFNINELGLEGLGSTITSLIRNCSNNQELELWFLCSEVKTKDKNNIKQLLQNESFKGTTEFADFNAKQTFGHLRSLHGDWTGYGRLLIENIVKSDSALYLDADLVVLLDVLALKDFQFSDTILAAVYGSPVRCALENRFFIQKLNWLPETGYFNSGVVLFNLQKWRTEHIESRWKSLSEKYPDDLLSIDQTLLNAVCEGKFAPLPPKFNNLWYPAKEKPEGATTSILHFVGSPKPWDFLGKIIHNGYDTWNMYNTPFWRKEYGKMSIDKMRRTWNIRRSLFRNLKNKVFDK